MVIRYYAQRIYRPDCFALCRNVEPNLRCAPATINQEQLSEISHRVVQDRKT